MKRSRRVYTSEFKRQVVEEYVDGLASQAQLCRRYELSPTLLREWRRKYDAGAYDAADRAGPTPREQDLMRRIADLERKVGQLTMENEVLQKRGALPRRPSAASGLLASGPNASASHAAAR